MHLIIKASSRVAEALALLEFFLAASPKTSFRLIQARGHGHDRGRLLEDLRQVGEEHASRQSATRRRGLRRPRQLHAREDGAIARVTGRYLHVIAAHLTEMWLGRTPNTPSHQKILYPFSVLVGMAVVTAATKFAGNTDWIWAEEQT